MTFFLLAILAMLAYSVYGTLITHHVRKHDGLSVAITRNLSLILTMAPILLLAKPENFHLLPEYLPKLALAGLTGTSSLVLSFWSLKFLPVGIKTALGRVSSVIIVFIIGWLWFGEIPTITEAIWIIPLLIGGTALATKKIKLEHLDSRTKLGVTLVITSAFLVSLSFSQMSDVARDLDPFIAGYIWEISIGLWALLFGIIRWIFCAKPPFAKIKLQEAGKIALISSPTLIGTGSFALAITMGPIGIANAIGSAGIFISILLGHWLYHEKMTTQQWTWIIICAIGLLGLGIAS